MTKITKKNEEANKSRALKSKKRDSRDVRMIDPSGSNTSQYPRAWAHDQENPPGGGTPLALGASRKGGERKVPICLSQSNREDV